MTTAATAQAGATKTFKLEYDGSVGWLIFWMVVLFPVGFVLLLTAGKFTSEGKTYFIRYGGSRGWLAFWFVACFPVAVVLLLLNGVALTIQDSAQVPIV